MAKTAFEVSSNTSGAQPHVGAFRTPFFLDDEQVGWEIFVGTPAAIGEPKTLTFRMAVPDTADAQQFDLAEFRIPIKKDAQGLFVPDSARNMVMSKTHDNIPLDQAILHISSYHNPLVKNANETALRALPAADTAGSNLPKLLAAMNVRFNANATLDSVARFTSIEDILGRKDLEKFLPAEFRPKELSLDTMKVGVESWKAPDVEKPVPVLTEEFKVGEIAEPPKPEQPVAVVESPKDVPADTGVALLPYKQFHSPFLLSADARKFGGIWADFLNKVQEGGLRVVDQQDGNNKYKINSFVTLQNPEGRDARLYLKIQEGSTTRRNRQRSVEMVVEPAGRDAHEKALLAILGWRDERFSLPTSYLSNERNQLAETMADWAKKTTEKMTAVDMQPAVDVVRSLVATIHATNDLESSKNGRGSFSPQTGPILYGPLKGKMTWEEADGVLQAFGNVHGIKEEEFSRALILKNVLKDYNLGKLVEETRFAYNKTLASQWAQSAEIKIYEKPDIFDRLQFSKQEYLERSFWADYCNRLQSSGFIITEDKVVYSKEFEGLTSQLTLRNNVGDTQSFNVAVKIDQLGKTLVADVKPLDKTGYDLRTMEMFYADHSFKIHDFTRYFGSPGTSAENAQAETVADVASRTRNLFNELRNNSPVTAALVVESMLDTRHHAGQWPSAESGDIKFGPLKGKMTWQEAEDNLKEYAKNVGRVAGYLNGGLNRDQRLESYAGVSLMGIMSLHHTPRETPLTVTPAVDGKPVAGGIHFQLTMA